MPNLRKIIENSFIAAAEHHPTISSTNDRAMAAAGEPNTRLPLLVLADVQTAGRGRGSNRWWTGPGSLAFSLLCKPPAPSQPSSVLVSLAAGVAVVEALAPLVPGHEIGIHWPNDIMLDGRKLAGILIEVLPDGKQVIGIGINANNAAADAPEDVCQRVATLRDATGVAHDPAELLIVILKRLEEQLAALACAPERITARTDELCLQRGTVLEVGQGNRLIVGTCRRIASDGALVIESAKQTHYVYSGTVATANGGA
jgi:BirA family transcriptional regulator, biotin operon repressor / biotin---[acetyl-CoA-carboxylase] ligase